MSQTPMPSDNTLASIVSEVLGAERGKRGKKKLVGVFSTVVTDDGMRYINQVNTTGPRHKLSEPERAVRRARNHSRRLKRSQRLSGASVGRSAWIEQAKAARHG